MTGILISLCGLLVFLFLFWKKLKEDYASPIVFSSAFFILAGGFLGYGTAAWMEKPWFFWSALAGGFFGLELAVLKYKQRFYETLEAGIVAALPLIGGFFLKDAAVNSSFASFVAFLTVLLLGFVYFLLNASYRGFAWYRSGRVGFAGLAVAVLFFLLRAGVAIFNADMLSFVGKSEVYLSGSLAVLGLLLLVNLGRVTK